jgi:hypothetical protein
MHHEKEKGSMIDEGEHERGRGTPFSDSLHLNKEMKHEKERAA